MVRKWNRALPLLLLALMLLASGGCVTLVTPNRYATRMVSFHQGAPGNAALGDPAKALGAPDMDADALSGFVNLGVGGTIVLEFVDGPAADGPGPDLMIHGDPANDELWKVEVSIDGVAWRSFGVVGELAALDLAAVGVSAARYVRITDDGVGPATGVSPGAELDAVGVLQTGSTAIAGAEKAATEAPSAASSSLLSRDWVRLGGPLGGLGYDIRMHPDNPEIMLVTDAWAGVHRSDDGGLTWAPSNAGIDARTGPSGDAIPVFCLTIDPNDPDILWAGTQELGMIYRSEDGGLSWQKRVEGIVEKGGLTFRGITVQAGDSSVVYAAGEVSSWQWAGSERRGWGFDKTKGVLYRSTDAGRHWQAIWRGDNLARYVWLDPWDPKVIYLSTGIFDREAANSDHARGEPGGAGIVKSVDGGRTWRPANTGLQNLYIGSLYMHPANPLVFLAGAGNNTYLEGSGVYLTTDGGAHWRQVQATEQAITSVEFSSSSPDVAYAGGAYDFLASGDGGRSWTSRLRPNGRWGPPGIVVGFPIDFQVDPRNPQRVFSNNYGGGNFLSEDGGRTWVSVSKGYTGADMRGVTVRPDNPAVVYVNGRSGPYLSIDGGAHWTGINPENLAGIHEGSQIAVDPRGTGRLVMDESVADRTFWSDDGGKSWRESSNDWREEAGRFREEHGWYNTGIEAIAFSPARPTRVYAAFGNNACKAHNSSCESEVPFFNFARSDDGGRSWIHLPNLPRNDLPAAAVVAHPGRADTVFIAVPEAGVFRSTDGGLTFIACTAGLGKASVFTLAMDPRDGEVLYAGTRAAGAYKSVDGGASWKPISIGMDPNEPIAAIVVDPQRPNVVYAGSLASGLYVSGDGGATWKVHNPGLRTRSILALAISSDGLTLYAGTRGEGMFRLSGLDQPDFDRLGASFPLLPR